MKNSLKFVISFLLAALLALGAVAIRAQQSQSGDQPDNSKSASNKPSAGASSSTADKAGSSTSATTPKPAAPPKPAAQKRTPPANSNGTVWVNTDSGLYHKPGTRWYGKTKHGKYMTEADAQKAGYRAASKE